MKKIFFSFVFCFSFFSEKIKAVKSLEIFNEIKYNKKIVNNAKKTIKNKKEKSIVKKKHNIDKKVVKFQCFLKKNNKGREENISQELSIIYEGLENKKLYDFSPYGYAYDYGYNNDFSANTQEFPEYFYAGIKDFYEENKNFGNFADNIRKQDSIDNEVNNNEALIQHLIDIMDVMDLNEE